MSRQIQSRRVRTARNSIRYWWYLVAPIALLMSMLVPVGPADAAVTTCPKTYDFSCLDDYGYGSGNTGSWAELR